MPEYIIAAGVMNYITGTYAVSLFPVTTLVHRRMVSCQDVLSAYPLQQPWVVKYQKRGFKIHTAQDPILLHPEMLQMERTVGDRFTWVLPFERSGTLLLIPQSLTFPQH